MTISLEEHIRKWMGKKADWDGYYEGQCVDLFRYYCDEVLGIRQPAGVWGAANFWSDFESDPVLVENFTKIINTKEFIPQKGDVAIWNFKAGGGYGHVATVSSDDNTLDYFYSFDQNWSKISYCEIVKHNYINIFGFLRPKKEPMADALTECLAQHTKLVDEANKKDKRITELEKQLADTKQECDNVLKAKQDFYDSKILVLENHLTEEKAKVKISQDELESLREDLLHATSVTKQLEGDNFRLNEQLDKRETELADCLTQNGQPTNLEDPILTKIADWIKKILGKLK